jgi:hypothetical protein
MPGAPGTNWFQRQDDPAWRPLFLDGVLNLIQSVLRTAFGSVTLGPGATDGSQYTRSITIAVPERPDLIVEGSIDENWQITLRQLEAGATDDASKMANYQVMDLLIVENFLKAIMPQRSAKYLC